MLVRSPHRLFLLAVACCIAAVAPGAVAEEAQAPDEVPEVQAGPSGELYDSDIYGWAAPPPDEQLAEDRTTVPDGQGAIFVPSLADPADEPEFVVFRGRQRIGSGSAGTRFVVEPGVYRVELGSGHERDVVVTVKVNADRTVLVPVTWGGLRVEVVDRHNIPHRAGYELIRVDDRDIYGVGYGADILAGERVRTWVLAEGLYRIVQPGATYRARSNYATVYIPAGGLVRYRLVIDPDTGEFAGAGVVTPEETGGRVGDDRLTPNLVLGVNGNLSIHRDVVGTAEVTVDGGVTFRDAPHTALALLQVEEGMRWINPEVGDALPLQKSDDRIRLDLLYTYDLTPAVGPYVRAGFEIAAFPTTVTTSNDIVVRFTDLDGTSRVFSVAGGDAFRTANRAGQTRFFQGAGVSGWAVRQDRGELKIGAGLGFRQTLYNDYYAEVPVDPASPAPVPDLAYFEVGDVFQEGVEALVTGRLRGGELLHLTTNLEAFSDFVAFDDPTIDWETTLSLRLMEMLSLDYVFELLRNPAIYDDVELGHEILLRFAWEVL